MNFAMQHPYLFTFIVAMLSTEVFIYLMSRKRGR